MALHAHALGDVEQAAQTKSGVNQEPAQGGAGPLQFALEQIVCEDHGRTYIVDGVADAILSEIRQRDVVPSRERLQQQLVGGIVKFEEIAVHRLHRIVGLPKGRETFRIVFRRACTPRHDQETYQRKNTRRTPTHRRPHAHQTPPPNSTRRWPIRSKPCFGWPRPVSRFTQKPQPACSGDLLLTMMTRQGLTTSYLRVTAWAGCSRRALDGCRA